MKKFHIIKGWIEIENNIDPLFPLTDGAYNYTNDGYVARSDSRPTLYDYDPLDGTAPFKLGDKIDIKGLGKRIYLSTHEGSIYYLMSDQRSVASAPEESCS